MPIFRRDGQSILFVHVPKTGGTSIERLFAASGYETLYRDSVTGQGSVNRLRKCSPQHMHAEMLDRIFNLGSFDFVFMLVREPLARFRSEYSMRVKDVQRGPGNVTEWAERVFHKYRQNNFFLDNHIRPQADFYVPGCVVYRLESGLEEIVRDINSRLISPLVDETPRALDSKKMRGVSSSQVPLAPSLVDRLRTFYVGDYHKFGYPLEAW